MGGESAGWKIKESQVKAEICPPGSTRSTWSWSVSVPRQAEGHRAGREAHPLPPPL